jgi:hypothetical protein
MRILAIAALLLLAGTASAGDDPWAALTERDLAAIHDILRANHPGAVDSANPAFAQWMELGLAAARERAAQAQSLGDYERALRFYTNGFSDGHIGIGLVAVPDQVRWPGFLLADGGDGKARVALADADAGVGTGAELVSCDRQTVDALLRERVDPYYWNVAIPHQRNTHLFRLFAQGVGDRRALLRACTFTCGKVELKWRRSDRDEYLARVDRALGRDAAVPGLARHGPLWWIRLPSFATGNPATASALATLLRDVRAQASAMRRGTVVFDVRGNHGGDSSWGVELATALWGPDPVRWVTEGFDNTVDWRASESNLRFMEEMVQREQAAGLAVGIAETTAARDAMRAALEQGRELARVDAPRVLHEGPAPLSPVRRVFLLTDHECASACLDFADLVRRLPQVTHIGLPTSADAIYIDNTYAELPSGLAGLGYSMKVFRNRVRANNEWYQPAIRWPGGPMTDAAVLQWVNSLL